MQRRWAAIYIAFFLVMAASSYSVMAVAEEPTIDVEGDTFQQGDTVEFGGTTYTFTDVSNGSATAEYSQTSQGQTTFVNNSVVEYDGGQYNVTTAASEQSFTLVEEFDVPTLLENDPEVDNSTYTGDDGTEFVRYRNGTTQPLDEYLPEPNRESFAVGESIQHANTSKTVDNVTASEAVLTWEETSTESIEFAEGDTMELDGTQYVSTFRGGDTLVLSTDVEGYQAGLDNQDYFQERMSSLMYVIVYCLGATFLLGAVAFLPHRG